MQIEVVLLLQTLLIRLRFTKQTSYKISLSIFIGMQAAADDSGSIPSIDDVFPSPFVTMSVEESEASSLDDPTSEPMSTPESPEVEPTSMIWSCKRSFATAITDDDGDGESFSDEIVDNGDDVMELKGFVMNIFGVDRPVSMLWLVDESGLGQIGKGEDPRLKLNKTMKLELSQ